MQPEFGSRGVKRPLFCGWRCWAAPRGGPADSLLPARVRPSRCGIAAGRPPPGLARGGGAAGRGWGVRVGVCVRASLSRGCEKAPLGGASTQVKIERKDPRVSCGALSAELLALIEGKGAKPSSIKGTYRRYTYVYRAYNCHPGSVLR